MILRRYSLTKFLFSRYNDNADVIIWTPHINNLHYYYGDNIINDVTLFHNLFKKKINVSRCSDLNLVKNKKNKKIYYSTTKYFNNYNFSDYSSSVRYVSKNLESEFEYVFPNYREVSFWENKLFMHHEFDRLGIKTPKTIYYEKDISYSFLKKELGSVFLLKEVHSCSAMGVIKIESEEVFHKCMKKYNFNEIVFQKLVPMRKDLRVVLVDDQIVNYYWRINPDKNWKPTSTSFGGDVLFDNFPDTWRENIIEDFRKLKIKTGAFDICWDNDDISGHYYILEVSTSYQPNPKPSEKNNARYINWKRSVKFTKDSYIVKHIENINFIKSKF